MNDETEEKTEKEKMSAFGHLFEGLGGGLGCFFVCLGIVAIIWALSAFPGLPR